MVEEVTTFEDYVALEERLFDEVRREVYTEVGTGPEFALVRYSAGSAADPATRQPDHNRSFAFGSTAPRGGILLLHGMSDSPYSLREIGETLNASGFWVIGLRLPGHGTTPSGLLSVRWQDMAAAGRLAMNDLVDKVGNAPIHVLGYSTGATLALDLALDALDDPSLRMPESLVLISPAIGVTRAAALAGTMAALGRIPGFGRLAYTQIVPEFDPYKYNSFTANAGAQVRKLTRSVAGRLATVARSEQASQLPPILVFKSAVDATVSTDAVVDRLLGLLPDNGNELVLFDINRSAITSTLLVADPGPLTNRLMADASLPFSVRLIGNDHAETRAVVSRYKTPFSEDAADPELLDLAWPPGVISLSHVALPFSPENELYGRFPPPDKNVLFLGQAEIRGERGLLRISSDWLLRLRYNPFYSLLETRILDWVQAQGPASN